MSDPDFRDAFRGLRDRYDGHHPDEKATLHRALFATRKQARRRRFTKWGLLPIAAALAASTAWADATGHLGAAVRAVVAKLHLDGAETTSSAPPAKTEGVATVPLEPPREAPIEESAPAPAPAPAPPPAPAPAPPPAVNGHRNPEAFDPSPPDPASDLFAEAHRLHFVAKDPARALPAWDAYLAASPNGRFAPEARYNRALALLRLGRAADARPELEAFANGTFGDYRRDEARALLDALARDAQ